MRLRSRHIIVGTVTLMTAFVVVAALRNTPPVKHEESVAGALPPDGADPGLVAKIAVDTPTFDMGVISNEKPTTKPLTVYNRGQAPLTLMNVKSSCSCTVAKLLEVPTTIPPGGASLVEVTIHPERIPAFFSDKMLSIYSNDPVTPTLRVSAVAHIDPELSMTPDKLDFGEVPKGETRTLTVRVKQLWDRPLQLGNVIQHPQTNEIPAPPSVFTIESVPVPVAQWEKPGKVEYDVNVTLLPWAPPGKLRLGIELGANMDRVTYFLIVVSADIKGDYTISPKYPEELRVIRMANPPSDKKHCFTIAGTTPLNVSGLTYDADALDVAPLSEAKDAQWTIEVKPKEGGTAIPGLYVIEATIAANGVEHREKMLVRIVNIGTPEPEQKQEETDAAAPDTNGKETADETK